MGQYATEWNLFKRALRMWREQPRCCTGKCTPPKKAKKSIGLALIGLAAIILLIFLLTRLKSPERDETVIQKVEEKYAPPKRNFKRGSFIYFALFWFYLLIYLFPAFFSTCFYFLHCVFPPSSCTCSPESNLSMFSLLATASYLCNLAAREW